MSSAIQGVPTRGVLVHSASSASCPHIEWATTGVLGVPADFDWALDSLPRGNLPL